MGEEKEQLDWFEDLTPEQAGVSVDEVDALCVKIIDARAECDRIKELGKDADFVLEDLDRQLLKYLERLNRKSWDSPLGKFSSRLVSSVRVPKGDLREEFFNYLKQTGEFDTLITVNSQTLNGWYKREQARAEEEGRLTEFKIPGIEESETKAVIAFKKK